MQFLVSLIVGIIIALIGQWAVALVLIGLSPLIIYGSFIRATLKNTNVKLAKERFT